MNKPRVLSLIGESRYSLLLADYLKPFELTAFSLKDIDVTEIKDEFDFAILDLETLVLYRQKIADWRDHLPPERLPLLVVASANATSSLATSTIECIDALVVEPINATELSISIAALLRIRQLFYKLQQKQRDLTAAKQLKSRFISAIAHEFHNPLHVISAVVQLLLRKGETFSVEKRQDSLRRVQVAVVRLTHMMNELLAFNRNASTQATFQPKVVDLKAFCQTVLEDATLVNEGIEQITFQVDGDLEEVCIDTELVRTILKNLLSNAVKYSPAGSPISLRIQRHERQVTIEVTDSGRGIPKEDQSTLFEAFFRARNVDTVKGTGLGLSIVKQCVDLHQGTIDVRSQLDQGTTFTVVLPLEVRSAVDHPNSFTNPTKIVSRIKTSSEQKSQPTSSRNIVND
ncbi:ATPase, histidine kinase-, DNA gyrase B-, and HSP90-like domain protein [Synechococcus sp. PCC 7335]|uniref:sensor histidine kinase n=1 Tax=Synechococcus sp. (strain ATCC 29403 / PCC 7335) TaxID=91464 RepID=UPI00017ED2AC|nr:HAMP domain-containing sensor histidine kinase [Synechococcus sp. PCC 7335]EDX83252.1 ATPase, histidine kinase-, DNA gyrase B-, and HSP90-like domain protein [Synechococcus sp. PCC 7335]